MMTVTVRIWLGLAGASGAFAVAVDAYARHRLDPVADSYALELLQFAWRYQVGHAIALILMVLLLERAAAGWCRCAVVVAGWAFVTGIVLFCGALYALAAGASPNHAVMAPYGGVALILGWLALAIGGVAWKR